MRRLSVCGPVIKLFCGSFFFFLLLCIFGSVCVSLDSVHPFGIVFFVVDILHFGPFLTATPEKKKCRTSVGSGKCVLLGETTQHNF